MRRYVLLALLLVVGLLPSGAGPAEAAGAEVSIFPDERYVAQSSPTFSVDIRAKNLSTPEMHVGYDETNVDADPALGLPPVVLATYAETNVDTDLALGNEEASEQRAQGFQVAQAGPVNRVLLWVKKAGVPIDGVKVELRDDSGGLPDTSPGGLLSGATVVAGEDLNTSYAWVAFDLASPPVLSPGVQYHLVVKRTLPDVDAANYYVWGADTSSPAYTDGAASVYDGSAELWGATSPEADHAFVVDTAPKKRSQGFRVPAGSPVNRVLLWLKRVGELTEDDGFLAVEIREDSGGVPGALVAASTGEGVDLLGTSYGWVLFEFTSPPVLSAGTQYHLVLKWVDMPETASYVVWGADTSSPEYGDGAAAEYYGGSTWVMETPEADHAFEVAYACPLDPSDPDPSSETGPCGLGMFELEIVFDTSDFQYDDDADPPSIQVGPFLTSTGRAVIPCSEQYDASDPANAVVTYSCTTMGGTPLGPQGSGVLATATFTAVGSGGPLNLGNTVLNDISDAPLTYSTQGNDVIVEDLGPEDSDGDGCADIEEAGDDLMLGGYRNPHDPYDFYDVYVPVKPDEPPGGDPDECYGQGICAASGPRSKKVDMQDVLAVLFYFGTRDEGPPTPNGVDYDADKGVDLDGDTDADIPPDGEDDGRWYDRSAAGPVSGPPSGKVDMIDVLAVLVQFGHNCTQPP